MLEFDHSHSRFSLQELGYRLRSIPAVFVLLPFAAGIALKSYVDLPPWCILALFALTLAGALWVKRFEIRALCVAVILLIAGWDVALLHGLESELPRDKRVDVVVRVAGLPERRYDYSVSEGVVEAWRDGDMWHKANSDVMLRLWDESLKEGDRVQLMTNVRGEMSTVQGYNRLLHHRGFEGRVDIHEGEFQRLEQRGGVSLHALAIRRLERYLRDSAAHATAEAMVVGSRRMVDGRVGENYAYTGLTHLMAISGLHLGIVMLLVNTLLAPLLVIYRGYEIRALIVIALLWLFAAVSGFTPSVVRSALMLTVFQLSRVVLQRYDSLNALIVVVIVMLMFNPNYLYDLSFQLSVLAVVGIVAWGVPIMGVVARRKMVGEGFTSTLIISMVATLWAMPIVAYAFEQVSFMSVIISPLVFVTAYLIVGCGVFAISLPGALATPFGYAMEFVAELQNSIVAKVAAWDFATMHYTLPGWGVALIYTLFVMITLVGWSWDKKKMVTLPIDE